MTENIKQQIEASLEKWGLLPEDVEEVVEQITRLRSDLKGKLEELDRRNISRTVIFANDREARQALDKITDLVVERKGLLKDAMSGEDVHDPFAIIKAEIETLIIETKVEPRTVANNTRRLKIIKRAPRKKVDSDKDE